MLRRRLGALVVCALVLALPSAAHAAKPIPDQYIVVLKDGSTGRSAAADHRRSAGARVLHTYDSAIHGYSARLSAAGLARVEADPRVARVVQDLEGRPLGAQTLPTGVNRIDADLSATAQLAGDGSGTVAGDVAVMDTGIDTTHPDLNVPGGVNCGPFDAYNDGTLNDGFGHGTHVAGTIGAKDDANGVVGVAPGVRVWAVRVTNRLGGSSTSAQLCGIDWVTANGPALGIKVANASMMMIGSSGEGTCASDVLHQAVCNSTQAGITWVFSAMNSTNELKTIGGAGYDEVLTVTAAADSNGQPNVGSTAKFTCTTVPRSNAKDPTGVDDTQAPFSNWTASVTEQAHVIAAPGMCIYSTFKLGAYGFMNGTSMAAPHAAATVHLCILAGQCSGVPAENIAKVRADAEAYNLANPGWGYKGDPLRPVTGRYFGYLIRPGLY
jgi:subtilisin family serine protease